MLITTLVVSFCEDGRGSVNVKLWFIVLYVWCEVLCRSVVLDNVFVLTLTLTNINTTTSISTERDDQRGNQHYSLELLMMGIVVPETC